MQTRKVFVTILFLSIIICPVVIAQSQESENDYLLQRVGVDVKIIPYAGVAIPLGEFPKGDYGAAQIGYSAGIQFIHNAKFGPVLHFNFASNKPDYPAPAGSSTADNWKNFLVLGGVKVISGEVSGVGSYYAAPLAGIMVSQKAGVAIADSNHGWKTLTRANNTAFAWGVTAGFSVKNFTLSAVFTYADTKYKSQEEHEPPYTNAWGLLRYETILRQKTEIVQINLGYAL